MINRTVSIGHDSILGDFSTIAPGVTISGMVKIGRKVTIGVGATIINDVRIGDNSVVGAGSLVLNDVPEDVVVIGTPAKVSKQN
jgi:acetyltransferase-like isoleucine patch superfamily enzyme